MRNVSMILATAAITGFAAVSSQAAVITYLGYLDNSSQTTSYRDSSVTKTAAYDPTGDNIYGTDGRYMFVAAGLSSSLPNYIALVDGSPGYNKYYGGGYGSINPPTGSLTPLVNTSLAGNLAAPNGGTVTLFTLNLTGVSANLPSGGFEVGVMLSGGNERPASIALGGVSATVQGSGAYAPSGPQMYFFNVKSLSASEVINFDITKRSGSNQAYITGFTFDTIVPEPASLGLIGLAGLALLRRRRA